MKDQEQKDVDDAQKAEEPAPVPKNRRERIKIAEQLEKMKKQKMAEAAKNNDSRREKKHQKAKKNDMAKK